MQETQQTPQSMRFHIGIFGKANAGKSSLMNALTAQELSIVSGQKGTTTDTVQKAVEIDKVGPCVFIDTAGFDDTSSLSSLRLSKTNEALDRIDLCILVFSPDTLDLSQKDKDYIKKIQASKKPCICILNKIDSITETQKEVLLQKMKDLTSLPPFVASCKKEFMSSVQIEHIKEEIAKKIPQGFFDKTQEFTQGLCKKDDIVVLVMPQDRLAPKGRLILAQVQVLRELLDKGCIVISCIPQNYKKTLECTKDIKLVITDSQVFSFVKASTPHNLPLTSFSILMAANKGDIAQFKKDTFAMKDLPQNSRFLIAEICTHHIGKDDIGQVKLPALIRTQFPNAKIDFTHGGDFPSLMQDGKKKYDALIHCGACMSNAQVVKTRQDLCKKAGVLMSNYGLSIAFFSGILQDLVLPQ